MRKIKWENIVFLGVLAIGIASIKHHITLNGFYWDLLLEVIMNTMFAFTFKSIIKDIRKNPSNWV